MTINGTEIGIREILDKIISRIDTTYKESQRQHKIDVDRFLKDPLSAAQKSLADRYRLVYFVLFQNLPSWKRDAIDDEPDGRLAVELAKEVARVAESDTWANDIDSLIK